MRSGTKSDEPIERGRRELSTLVHVDFKIGVVRIELDTLTHVLLSFAK